MPEEEKKPILKNIVDEYMSRASGVKELCKRCLSTERWGGSVVLMVVDAAFTSIGMNYFTTVITKVEEFNNRFVLKGKFTNLEGLAKANLAELQEVWKNKRSWMLAKDVASYITSTYHCEDRKAFRTWALNSTLEGWENDPIGKIKGTGIVTFQYLRMMGGVDTVMPDKIVKRVLNEIFAKAKLETFDDNLVFVKKAEEVAISCGYKPIEFCWMTWLIQQEGNMMKQEKYSSIVKKI